MPPNNPRAGRTRGLNLLLHAALDGGVSRNLHLDRYGKAVSSALLALEPQVPEERLGRPEAGDRATS